MINLLKTEKTEDGYINELHRRVSFFLAGAEKMGYLRGLGDFQELNKLGTLRSDNEPDEYILREARSFHFAAEDLLNYIQND